ncbi:MAG: T9SS type A sorting domain-containing protein, partial [Parafilimonas sp.]|nr:T9SS type A sorting domain-containing protein [Parafilimonas sp.]
YPNPSNGIFTIGIDEDAGIKAVKIADENGKIIYENSLFDKATVLKLNLSMCISGIYFINAINNKTEYHKKIIIQK